MFSRNGSSPDEEEGDVVVQLEEMVMVQAQRNAELETKIDEMQAQERTYIRRIEDLEGNTNHGLQQGNGDIKELEEMAMNYATRNTELENVVKQQESHINQLQQAEEMALQYEKQIQDLETVISKQSSQISQMQQAAANHVSQIAKLQHAAAEQDSSNEQQMVEMQEKLSHSDLQIRELEATVCELKESEQKYIYKIEQMQSNKDIIELEQMAMGYASRIAELEAQPEKLQQEGRASGAFGQQETEMMAQQISELEAVVREMKREEEDYLSQIVQLRQGADREMKRNTELEVEMGQMQQDRAGLMAQINELHQASSAGDKFEQELVESRRLENDLRAQLDDLLTARAQDSVRGSAHMKDVETNSAAQSKRILELEAVVHAMSQREQDYESQVAQLKGSVRLSEADAAACGKRNTELESELSSLRVQQENGTSSCDAIYAARIAELEAAVEAHAKRNAENEAVMKSMQEREGRIAKLEQALTAQMHPMPPSQVMPPSQAMPLSQAASVSVDWAPATPHEAPKADRMHSEPVAAVEQLSQNFKVERKVTAVSRTGDDIGTSPSHSPVPQVAMPSVAVPSQFTQLPPKVEPSRFAGSVVIPSSGTGGGSLGGSVQFSSIRAPRAGSVVCNVSPKTSTRMPSLGSAKEGGQQQGETMPPRQTTPGMNTLGPTFGGGSQFAGLFGSTAASPGRMSGASPARMRAASPCVARGVSPIRSPVSCGLPTFGCSQGAHMRNASPIRPRADMQQSCGPMMRSASPVRMNSTPHSLPGYNPSKAGYDQQQPASRMTPLHELANKNCH